MCSRNMEKISTSPAEEIGRVAQNFGQLLRAHHWVQVAEAIDDTRVAETQEMRHHGVDLSTPQKRDKTDR
jgi:hypothetical protein